MISCLSSIVSRLSFFKPDIRMSRYRFLAFLSCVAALPLTAQTFPTSDPVIKRIYTLGMDSTHLYTEAHVLFDSLGPRLMGTPNIKRAQDWLTALYKSWGIDAKEENYGTWRGWIRGYSHIDLVEPRVRSLEGQMVGYSPGTNGKPVTLSTIILPQFADSNEFVKWLPQARGKLVMISAALPTCRSQEQWNTFGTPESVAKLAADVAAARQGWTGRNVRGTGYSAALGGGELGVRLEQGGAAGIITSRPKLTLNVLPPAAGAAGRGAGGGGRGGGGGGRGGSPSANISLNLNLANGTATIDTASLRAALAAAGGRGRGSSGGVGAMEVFETYNTRTPAIALNCEDYGLVFRLTEGGDKRRAKSAPRRSPRIIPR
jgi:hypothetical protein